MELPITSLNDSQDYVTNLEKYDHITDAMRSLHWLPVESRVKYIVLVLVNACIYNVAPPCLSNLLTHKLCPIERKAVGCETDSPSTDS